eukprot:maker-scaffold19_size710362-snap-gene-6.13 protein:Tk00415 transcript:maker-scaffold19_size710362-snap-gene-6.13-mRNA-1 annotation:"AGAP001862-PA"
MSFENYTYWANLSEADLKLLEDCPEYGEYDQQLRSGLSFWMEGVIQTTIAISGVFFNIFSSLILASKDMRNSFNLLLIALACFDCCYLLGSILESFRKSFHLATSTHTLLFPYVLFPGQMISMTASVLMTVAIAMERYVAVHYPLDYNQSMNDEHATLRRVLKYVVPVSLFSVLCNIPKFFEAQIQWENDPITNVTQPMLRVSDLRMNEAYITYYNHYFRLLFLGIIPFGLLVFFNTKIYQDIQPVIAGVSVILVLHTQPGLRLGFSPVVRRRRRCPRPPSSNSNSGDKGDHGGASKRDGACQVQKRNVNANRRRYEDNLAVIFMGIVIFFLVSHFPRIFLGLHEVFVSTQARLCGEHGKRSFSLWVHVFTYVSHLLLVLNSSVNSLIYCILSSRFRLQVMTTLNGIGLKFGFKKDPTRRSAMRAANNNGVANTLGVINNGLKEAISLNGLKSTNGMTTVGKSHELTTPEESPLLENQNGGLTQTTQ